MLNSIFYHLFKGHTGDSCEFNTVMAFVEKNSFKPFQKGKL